MSDVGGVRYHGRIAVLLTDDSDWEEIEELVIESYQLPAPKPGYDDLIPPPSSI